MGMTVLGIATDRNKPEAAALLRAAEAEERGDGGEEGMDSSMLYGERLYRGIGS